MLLIGGVAVAGILWYTGAFCKFQFTANTPLCRNMITPQQNALFQQRNALHNAARLYQHQRYAMTGR